MVDLVNISIFKANSLDREENTTSGFTVIIQVWRLVLEFGASVRL